MQKTILHGTPSVFKDREGDYFDFRNRIAHFFQWKLGVNLGYHEVFIVGSAKLGFSPHKGSVFNFDSDVDVAIVNEQLFDKYHEAISLYQYDIEAAKVTISRRENEMYREFLMYFAKGWMRPDKLPLAFQMKIGKDDWFEFFRSISYDHSEVGNYKVNAGLYKSFKYLETYLAQMANGIRVNRS